MLALFLVLIGSIPVALLRGLVLSNFVDWFTPYHIGVVQAVGLATIFGLLTTHLQTSAKQEPGQSLIDFIVTVLFTQTMMILICWFFGWVWHFFL